MHSARGLGNSYCLGKLGWFKSPSLAQHLHSYLLECPHPNVIALKDIILSYTPRRRNINLFSAKDSRRENVGLWTRRGQVNNIRNNIVPEQSFWTRLHKSVGNLSLSITDDFRTRKDTNYWRPVVFEKRNSSSNTLNVFLSPLQLVRLRQVN